MDTTAQPIDDSNSRALIITSNTEGDHPVPSLGRLPVQGDIPNPTVTQQRWNGNPMDCTSWPIGRPGPLVSEATMRDAMNTFHFFDSERDEWSRTQEKVFHVAEFSSTGRGEFDVYRS